MCRNTKSSYMTKSCNCGGGLGEADTTEQKNQTAEKTQEDMMDEAKKYINDEIPKSYKIGAGAALVVGIWWFTSGKG